MRITEKLCRNCGTRKPINQFYLVRFGQKKSRYSSLCRICDCSKRSLRDRRVRQQTPAWANKKEMRKIYGEAKLLTQKSGIKMSVDHIVPIKGKFVCGLHVEYNLRIITKRQNSIKHNRLYDDIEYVPIVSELDRKVELKRKVDRACNDIAVKHNTCEIWELPEWSYSLRREARAAKEYKERRAEQEDNAMLFMREFNTRFNEYPGTL